MKSQPYYSVRTSKIHGRGVFARRPIRKGTKIIEYTGEIVSDKEADKIGASDVDGHSHTMLFSLGNNKVINGNVGGNAKYINHSCAPNAETVQDGDQIFIEALRSIKTGEEITYDYHLEVDGKITKKVIQQFACRCGTPACRGTQIAASILAKQAKKDALKQAIKDKKDALKKEKKDKKAALKEQLKLKKAAEKAAKKEAKRIRKNKKSSVMVDEKDTSKKKSDKKKDKKKKNKKKNKKK